MFIRRIDTSKNEPRVGGATTRIAVFLFGAVFAVVAIAALFERAFIVAGLLAFPALILFAIALWGKKKPLAAAQEAASIAEDIGRLH